MKYLNLIFILLLILHYYSQAQVKHASTKTLKTNDSISIRNTIQGFLIWYKDNYLRLYDYSLTKTDSSAYYQVDLTSCNNFLHELKSSQFISNEFVRLWNQYFESRAENFKINPQNEGPPEGFDMDLILHLQEPEEILKNINSFKYKFNTINKSYAEISILTPWPDLQYSVELSKLKNKWNIDYISLKEPE